MVTVIEFKNRPIILGCRPRIHAPGEVLPLWEERVGARTLPRSEWKPVSYRHLVPKILDQDGQGACTAFASVQTLQTLRAEVGLPFVELSAGNLYGRINGGMDAGSLLSDAIVALEKEGVCKASTVGQLDWHRRNWPANWQEEAAKFRVLEAWDCPSFDQLASALQFGFLVAFGVLVGANFVNVDSDGWVPDRRGGGGGHAMCGVGLAKRGSTWGIEVANSWGSDWGQAGFGVVPESYFRDTRWTDGWAVRGVVDPEGAE